MDQGKHKATILTMTAQSGPGKKQGHYLTMIALSVAEKTKLTKVNIYED